MKVVIPVLLVVAACGGGDGPGGAVDAPPTVDATSPDAPDVVGPVTVVVVPDPSLGTPVGEMPVIFYDRYGEITARTTTAADGTATAMVAAGAAVTVVVGYKHAFTTLALQPGDRITIPQGASVSVPAATTTLVSVMSPGGTGNFSLGAGLVDTAHAGTAGNAVFFLDSREIENGTFDVLALQGNKYVGDFGRAAPPGATVSFTLGSWRTDWIPFGLSLTHLGPTVAQVSTSLYAMIGARRFRSSNVAATPSGGTASAAMTGPKGPFTGFEYRAYVSAPHSISEADIDLAPSDLVATTLDASTQLLPIIQSATATLPNGASGIHIALATADDAALAHADGVSVTLQYTSERGNSFVQTITAPAGASIDVPKVQYHEFDYGDPVSPFDGTIMSVVIGRGGVWQDATDFRQHAHEGIAPRDELPRYPPGLTTQWF